MTTYVQDHLQDRETLRLCTAGSVDDGKSTFVGRLLHDTKSVLADQLSAVERTSREKGLDQLDLSLLVDGLRAEREQGITIDVAYRYFSTPKRTFILADTPGHVQYTRNTVTGVSTSQVVVLLVDARTGIVEQTRRHLRAAELLGVRTVVLAVNKIDLVDFDSNTFDAISQDFRLLAAAFDQVHVVPISALYGDNVVEPSAHMPWYTGPTVLELLENISVTADRVHDLGFRFPIQYVIREHSSDYRGYAGSIATGQVAVGDTVTVGQGRTTQVLGIDTSDGPVDHAQAGDAVVLLLADDIDLSRGDLIAGPDRPDTVRSITATVVGLADKHVRPGQKVRVRYGTSLVRARIADGEWGLNDVTQVSIDLASELPVEPYAARGAVGAFLVIDQASGDTLGAGLVTSW